MLKQEKNLDMHAICSVELLCALSFLRTFIALLSEQAYDWFKNRRNDFEVRSRAKVHVDLGNRTVDVASYFS